MGAVALPRRLAAEFVGSGLLVTVVVGSGIAAADDVVVPHERDPLGHTITEQRSAK